MKKFGATVILMISAASSAAAGADLRCADDFPEVGRDQNVALSGVERPELLTLWVVYSPNSETQSETEVGRLSGSGEITWIPSRFGIATLSVRDGSGAAIASENVAIVFASPPLSGVLVMLFAGALLFGGAAISLRSVLREGVPSSSRPSIRRSGRGSERSLRSL